MANYYRNYADMFETMSLLDIVSWTVGVTVVSAAAGWALGKIAECAIDKIGDYGDIVTKDPVTQYKTENGVDDE